jgi:iron complex transport system substrate-binding protein
MIDSILERPLTRRQLLAAGIAAGVSLLAGCGSDGQDAPGWTFVDDRKHEVSLSKRPTRIVAYTTAAAALHQWGVTPVGVFGDNPRQDASLASFPWERSQIVGSVYGEIDVAALLAVRAELIVSRWYPLPDDSPVFGFKDLAQQKSIGSKVPIVGIDGHRMAMEQIRRFGDLARSLGVDTGNPTIADARAAFSAAAKRLSAVARRKSGLRIIAASGEQSTMYVAKLVDTPDLTFYKQQGVPLVSARTSAMYWDSFSWGQAAKYPADGILYDAREFALPLSVVKTIPAFATLPAVRANQIGAWQADTPPSYQAYTQAMNDLATTIAGWRKVT